MVSTGPTQVGERPETYGETGRRIVPTAAVGGASIGALLRERREALGATLAEVEAATKIRQKYLSALEADEWQSLPGEVVGRGFLRNYAGYLGMEPTEIIERRRIAADPSLSSALAATSAGSALPPVRAVDYRPKDVDLREEPDTLEERPPLRLMPILLVVAALAVAGGLWWGFSRMGDNALDDIAAAGSGLTDRVGAFFASDDPTATPAMAVLAGGANRAGAESTSVFDSGTVLAEGGDNALGTGSADSTPAGALSAPAVDATPTTEPTPTPVPPTPTPEPPTATPTPAFQSVAVVTQANLRSVPSLDGTIAGGVEPGVLVNIIGISADQQWYRLDNGNWIFAQLVAAPPVAPPMADPNVPVAAPVALPADPAADPNADPNAAPTAEGDAVVELLLPTPTPLPAEPPTPEPAAPPVASSACADPRSLISSPGAGQSISGRVAIEGTARHEAFASYKVEAGPAGAALNFIASGNSPIDGGVLGSLDSATLPNGPAVIRLTVIDQTGNYPPPCEITVTVAN